MQYISCKKLDEERFIHQMIQKGTFCTDIVCGKGCTFCDDITKKCTR
jgi:hypothetical protein